MTKFLYWVAKIYFLSSSGTATCACILKEPAKRVGFQKGTQSNQILQIRTVCTIAPRHPKQLTLLVPEDSGTFSEIINSFF